LFGSILAILIFIFPTLLEKVKSIKTLSDNDPGNYWKTHYLVVFETIVGLYCICRIDYDAESFATGITLGSGGG
jgi:hypothetical protein